MAVRRVVDGLLYAMPPVSTKPGSHLQKYMKASSARPRDEHQTGSGRVTQPRIMVKSARRRAMLRVQRRTPGQRVAKNHHVRRQLRRPRSFPLSQNFARCCTKHCNRVPKLHLFRARPKSTHPWTPINSLTPTIPKNPGELRLDCVKTGASQGRNVVVVWRLVVRPHRKAVIASSHEALYSITSSARARKAAGTVKPSALAVFILMTSWKRVGCSTGKSAGFSPLRTRLV